MNRTSAGPPRVLSELHVVLAGIPLPAVTTLMPNEWRRRLPTGIVALLAVLAACEPPQLDHLQRLEATSTASDGVDLATAEWVVREYFSALRDRRTEEARALLAAGPRSDMDPQEMVAAARELAAVEVGDLVVTEASAERIVFRLDLHVTPDARYPGAWQPGVNTRWIEVVRGRRGWRIGELAAEPVTAAWAPVRVWTPIHVLEAEISVDLPHGWFRRTEDWSWSPNPGGWPYVGLNRREAREGAPQAPAIPPSSRVLRSGTVELEWGEGTQYTLELPGSIAGCGTPTCFEHTLTVPDDRGRTYTFFARTARSEDLRPLLAVLRRMYRSAELTAAATLSARASGPECRGVTTLGPGSGEGEMLAAELRILLTADAADEAARARPVVARITRLQSWALLEFIMGGDGQPAIAVLREGAGRRELVAVVTSLTPQRDQAAVRAELTEILPDASAALARCTELARDDRQP